MRYNDGILVGTAAAQDIEVGFVPSWVKVINQNSGTGNAGVPIVYEGPVAEVISFDSGGTEPITAGQRVDAMDGGWRGIVKQVIVYAGTWAAGTADGFLVFEPGTLVGAGNIADNDVIYTSDQVDVRGPATDRAAVEVAGLKDLTTVETSTFDLSAAAGVRITPYYGASGEKSHGFTFGATISDSDNMLFYQAWAPDPGSDIIDIYGG